MIGTIKTPATITALEEALVALHDLWWRTPMGGGASPFAKDGPWHLGQFEAGDLASYCSLTLLTNEAGRELIVTKLETPRPKASLSCDEVDLRDQVDEWLMMVPDADRDLVRHVTLQDWRGHRRDWATVARRIGSARSVDALRVRYRKVMAELLCRINGVPLRHARTLRRRDAVLSHPGSQRES